MFAFSLSIDSRVRCPVCARLVEQRSVGNYGETKLVKKHRRIGEFVETCRGSWTFPADAKPTAEDEERRSRFIEMMMQPKPGQPVEQRGGSFERLELAAALRHLRAAAKNLAAVGPLASDAARATADALKLTNRALRACDPWLLKTGE